MAWYGPQRQLHICPLITLWWCVQELYLSVRFVTFGGCPLRDQYPSLSCTVHTRRCLLRDFGIGVGNAFPCTTVKSTSRYHVQFSTRGIPRHHTISTLGHITVSSNFPADTVRGRRVCAIKAGRSTHFHSTSFVLPKLLLVDLLFPFAKPSLPSGFTSEAHVDHAAEVSLRSLSGAVRPCLCGALESFSHLPNEMAYLGA